MFKKALMQEHFNENYVESEKLGEYNKYFGKRVCNSGIEPQQLFVDPFGENRGRTIAVHPKPSVFVADRGPARGCYR